MSNPIFRSQYTAAQIEASIGKTPRINTTTRTWETWDIATSAYVNTGVSIDGEEPVGSITMSASWTGNNPYTQTVTVTGATVTSHSLVSLQPTAAQMASLISAGVSALTIENNNGTLTAYAIGSAPSAAMTMQCTVTEVDT